MHSHTDSKDHDDNDYIPEATRPVILEENEKNPSILPQDQDDASSELPPNIDTESTVQKMLNRVCIEIFTIVYGLGKPE